MYAFIGQYKNILKNLARSDRPAGFIRTINMYGNIFEGAFTPDGKMNGFCICFIGGSNIIDIGWYKDNKMNGNCMSFKAFKHDLEFKESGWYAGG